MEVKVLRYGFDLDCTIGLMFINDVFEAYTLEDEYREPKVYGETCIPDGRYRIVLRAYGGFHARYLEKFGADFHKGMLEVSNVPNFKDILIHIGNTDEDTAGCLLVGNRAELPINNYIGDSTNAYKRIYSQIIDAILGGEPVYITYKRIES